MDAVGQDYRQVVSLPNPPIEEVTTPSQGVALIRIANDALAELVARHKDRFPGFVAGLAMHDMDATMTELHRAIGDLGALGVQIFTNVNGRPLDDPAYAPLFEAMAAYDKPIWMHPTRSSATSDYAAEKRSRFEIWSILGWPYETSAAMARMVFSGLFDRHPRLKIITHHLGGMIPYFAGRIDEGWSTLGSRTTDEDYSGVLASLKRPHREYFKMFYGDTALMGSVEGTKCGVEYFGTGHVVFASDAPFASIAPCVEAVKRLELDAADAAKIGHANLSALTGLALA
jgi:aminocarboxymuconate-semialdehyde decarboxylase